MTSIWIGKNDAFIPEKQYIYPLVTLMLIFRMEEEDILLVAAHDSEAFAIEEAVKQSGLSCGILVTGVGGMKMSWSLQNRLHTGSKPKIIINAGIAGTYSEKIKTGDFVIVGSECFADMGIDDNGRFISLFSSGLASANEFPFTNGRIICRNLWFDNLSTNIKVVSAATVNMSSGSESSISRIVSEWNPDVETMEGAWFSYFCEMNHLPWLSLRSISNRVEPRNVKNWDINSALYALKVNLPYVLKIILEQ